MKIQGITINLIIKDLIIDIITKIINIIIIKAIIIKEIITVFFGAIPATSHSRI